MDAPWEPLLTERDRAVFPAAGYGVDAAPAEVGDRPALVVVDMTRDFVGDRPEPVLESIRRYPNSCGAEAWEAMDRLAPLLAAARRAGVPIVYTANDPSPAARSLEAASWARRNARVGDRWAEHGSALSDIAPPIAPEPGDVVVLKTKPSAFFDTPLRQYLTMWGTDTVVCCGATTSGCVRATVVDAFSHGYDVVLVADATVDRGQASHAIGLFDMFQKYARLTTAAALTAVLAGRASTRPAG
ncbi:MAG TPA: isochorismatase family cysteine hydrolase [Acidimicrobiales bacterium]